MAIHPLSNSDTVDRKTVIMANHASAKTRIRRNGRRTDINLNRLNRVRTYIKKVEAAVAAGDKTAAEAMLKAAQPEIQRGVTKGVLPKNRASRKISRLSRSIKALA